jgi:hypothetical protein
MVSWCVRKALRYRRALSNKRLERTRHEQASLLSNLGEPLKRSVRFLLESENEAD